MKFKILLILLILATIAIPILQAEPPLTKISPEVLNELNNSEKINVTIKLKEKSTILRQIKKFTKKDKFKDIEEKDKYKNFISKEVSLEELEELENNPDIESISKSHKLKAFLQQAVPIINSSIANSLKINNINLTGTGRSVCVIDSGINFTHPDLIGKNLSCIIDCFNKVCVENCLISDDNGHGTHVAGIAAASGGILGVANNVSLIGIKILDENGDGSGNDLDLSRAIDYCVAQNVDVISMSLGTSSLYNTDCSHLMSPWTESINLAFAANISVIAATGNKGNFTHISSPACIGNATPVGDTYDANIGGVTWVGTCTDSTTAIDQIVCHANRNSLVQLFAPGALINSTYNNGAYYIQGGTSMAAPMVAGAFAIMHQILNLTSQTRTPLQIENILNSTGKTLNDAPSGLSFSRIDVYEAALSLDNLAPNITLTLPTDNLVNLKTSYNFTCNQSDWQLTNTTFYLWNSTSLVYNETSTTTGTTNTTNFTVNNLPKENYKWNCKAYDSQSNSAFSSTNFSLTIGGLNIILSSPENATSSNQEINFTCNLSSVNTYSLTNTTFYLWNSTSLVYNETSTTTGITNTSTFNYSFTQELPYNWNCLAYNNASNSSWADTNFTVTYDTTYPNISTLFNTFTSTTSTITWTTNENTNSSINYGTTLSLGTYSTNSILTTSHSETLSGLIASTLYYYNITYCDQASNCNTSTTNSFTTSATSTPTVSSSGGGGGGTTSKTYTINSSQASNGYTQSLNKNDKIKFTFFDTNGNSHALTLSNIGTNFVDLIIQSDPINLKLGIGQSTKLNLTSPDYYDLYIKLNSITSGKADLTIQTINEKILPKDIEITGDTIKTEEETPEKKISQEMDQLVKEIKELKKIVNLLVILIIIVIIFLFMKRKEKPNPKSQKRKIKHSFLKELLDIK